MCSVQSADCCCEAADAAGLAPGGLNQRGNWEEAKGSAIHIDRRTEREGETERECVCVAHLGWAAGPAAGRPSRPELASLGRPCPSGRGHLDLPSPSLHSAPTVSRFRGENARPEYWRAIFINISKWKCPWKLDEFSRKREEGIGDHGKGIIDHSFFSWSIIPFCIFARKLNSVGDVLKTIKNLKT